jgi:hypothetical protein
VTGTHTPSVEEDDGLWVATDSNPDEIESKGTHVVKLQQVESPSLCAVSMRTAAAGISRNASLVLRSNDPDLPVTRLLLEIRSAE